MPPAHDTWTRLARFELALLDRPLSGDEQRKMLDLLVEVSPRPGVVVTLVPRPAARPAGAPLAA